MSSRPPLDDVVAAAVGGSVPAFEKLYGVLAPAVASYLRWHGVADVEGVTNEVFAQAHRKMSTFEGDEARFRSWLFTIAHHRMIDERRKAARRPPVDDDADLEIRAGVGDAERDALAVLGDEQVMKLLRVLSPDQRDVVLLRVIADMSLDDTATALGKRRGAVKALQHRALASLRRHLEREGSSRP